MRNRKLICLNAYIELAKIKLMYYRVLNEIERRNDARATEYLATDLRYDVDWVTRKIIALLNEICGDQA